MRFKFVLFNFFLNYFNFNLEPMNKSLNVHISKINPFFFVNSFNLF